MKRCPHCKRDLPRSYFGRKGPRDLQPYCRECMVIRFDRNAEPEDRDAAIYSASEYQRIERRIRLSHALVAAAKS